jgi:hypothetical protein
MINIYFSNVFSVSAVITLLSLGVSSFTDAGLGDSQLLLIVKDQLSI